MIRAWWQGLAPRERRMVGGGAVLVAFLLGWAFLWHPLALRRTELARQVDAQRLELARVRAAAAELQRLRATGTRARGDREGRSLLALADATARDAGLAQALKRVEPVAGNAVRASFETASFDGLVEWMELLATRYGVQASDLSAERADGVGLVNARVMLQDAP